MLAWIELQPEFHAAPSTDGKLKGVPMGVPSLSVAAFVPAEGLWAKFVQFASFGRLAVSQEMDSLRFAKLCNDCGLTVLCPGELSPPSKKEGPC
jgi:hypothetical protein